MKSKIYLKFILFFLCIVLSGCASNGPRASSEETSYPFPQNLNVTISPTYSGYPYPGESSTPEITNEFLPAPLIVPTPSSDKVVFWGQMLTPGPGGTPYLGDIYLGYLVKATQSGYPPMIKFSETTNPKAVVDTEGHFYFADVDPGEYALVIYSLGGTYVVSDKSGQTSYITGVPGSSVDLGIISVP
ncbi:hypothetical protein LARV_01521 [Longilinea arvoryzae]|uniref:Carboxypeptidase regulatory-like domain-containing protein n=1 Tax=Longilinea arvoryzae TaxID=360412 RepID=A0A0S7BGX0_9CHLR|nr:hypothetical protein [Longilinea arvoryzae]GAP13766.1 hypothetical protein LARV_01521 [Longilinea arvoryzae]